jgi:hypothetical protein
MEGKKPHLANCRGDRHAKEELQKKKTQRTPNTTTGRVFSSNLTTPSVSFVAALRGSRILRHAKFLWQILLLECSLANRLPDSNNKRQVSQSVLKM